MAKVWQGVERIVRPGKMATALEYSLYGTPNHGRKSNLILTDLPWLGDAVDFKSATSIQPIRLRP